MIILGGAREGGAETPLRLMDTRVSNPCTRVNLPKSKMWKQAILGLFFKPLRLPRWFPIEEMRSGGPLQVSCVLPWSSIVSISTSTKFYAPNVCRNRAFSNHALTTHFSELGQFHRWIERSTGSHPARTIPSVYPISFFQGTKYFST